MNIIPITFQSVVSQDVTISLNGKIIGTVKPESFPATEMIETEEENLSIKASSNNFADARFTVENYSHGEKMTFLIMADEIERKLQIERKY